MATYQKVGSFQLNTSPGSQSVSGLGFQPKVILFFHNPSTTDVGVPQIANDYGMIGAATATTQRSAYWFNLNGNAGNEVSYYNHSSYCICCGVNPGSSMWYADLTSMDGDGFTLNVLSTVPDVYRVGYMAFGGDDLTGFSVGEFISGATGVQSLTGLGFQPTALLAFTVGNSTALKTTGAAYIGEWAQSFGMSDGATSYCTGLDQRSANVATKIEGKVQAAHFLGSPSRLSPNTWRYRANLTSFDVDGFTLNWLLGNAGMRVFYLALEGPLSEVGYFQAPTLNGLFTPITSLPFQPRGIILNSSCQPGFGDIEGNGEAAGGVGAQFSYGFATADLEQFNIEGAGVDFTVTSYDSFYQSKTNIFARYLYNNRGVLEEQIEFDNFTSNSVSLNATTTLGLGTSAIPYMVIQGDDITPPPPSDPTGGSGDPSSPDSSFLFNMI